MLRECKVRIVPFVLDNDESTGTTGNNKELDIDSFSTQPAMLNCYGFPMNDIQAYETSQSESVARSVLQRIKVNPDNSPEVEKRSVAQQFEDLCPANWDSPAEFLRYQSSVATNAFKRAENLRKIKAEKADIEKNKPISFVSENE